MDLKDIVDMTSTLNYGIWLSISAEIGKVTNS